MDNIWKQEKPEARKMLETATNSICPVRVLLGAVFVE
jgi:hypothetical protein